MSTIDELLHTRDEFERTIQQQCNLLALAEQHLSTERCPNREELAPVLHSIQEMSKSLAGFLEKLNDIWNDTNSWSRLENMSFQEVMPNVESARDLMKPRHVLITLANAFYHNQTPTSLLWEQSFDLAIWYSEHRNTTASFYYIIENHIQGYFTDSKWLWNWVKDFYDQHRVTALYFIAKRATFLERAKDSEIEAEEATWWCERIDSFPKVSTYYDVFTGLLNHCPDAKNPYIVERLKEFALFENLDENEFIKGQQETIRSKAISLLTP